YLHGPAGIAACEPLRRCAEAGCCHRCGRTEQGRTEEEVGCFHIRRRKALSVISFDRLIRTAGLAFLVAAPTVQAQWTAPTPEELSMTSIPQVPGAAAAYLF